MTTYTIAVTDTFGGEANYAWVRRATLAAPPALSRRSLVRRAKALMDWTGLPCAVHEYADCIELRPRYRSSCMVMFITPAEEPAA